MPEVFIDGKRYEYEGQPMLLQFILDQGLEVPFFCYHPSMSIPANCRQCMVKVGTPVKDRETGEFELDENGDRKIRWFPKPQTSCSTPLQDGMVVHTQETSEEIARAQKDNLEFILINHPLDCPICDQAGECPLQIQTYKYGPEGSRFEVKKVHKPKHVDLGPRVTLDAERCINCTRCVRFTEEISETNQLTIVDRGDSNYPTTAPGETFDDPYSMNTVDICPVGALTSTDFRFKARVWEMNQTPSIDITNGKGCNIDLWTRDNEVLRITPRQNEDVNDYWMPDAGRDAYKLFNENRVDRPSITLDENNQSNTSWNNAIETFAEVIEANDPSDITIVGSPHASVEENYVFNKFFNLLGVSNAKFTPHVIPGSGDGFLITDDQAPNTNGCRVINLDETDDGAIQSVVSDAKVVIILSDDLIGRDVLTSSDLESPYTISLATNISDTTKASDLVIPITCVAEHAASYVNVDGRIQRSYPAKETKYTNRRLNLEMSEGRLDRFGTNFDNWVSEENKVDCLPLWEFLNKLADRLGLEFEYNHSREIFTELSNSLDVLSNVSYDRMDEEKGVQLPIKQKEVKA
ncbi:2Fe-2S iron-sulfur cluster-binding protein [Fodinibius sp. N2]|uniref:2Fe-2S iron-sulfur cluster-binding protein n=1 Tax=Fodinibius alkaliphilus TaxID=3140241 RepID=UPI00315A8980